MSMRYDRDHPSPRFEKLLTQYRRLHEEGDSRMNEAPDQVFPGKSLRPQAHHIRRLIQETGARTILDYGCGKGTQYLPLPFTDAFGVSSPNVKAYWGAVEVSCYDPAYKPFAELPEGKYDGVISTDVLEHCPEDDMEWIVAELFGYARRFVFANVACYPANRLLPNGGNAHCTIRPPKWWRKLITTTATKFSGVRYELRLQSDRNDSGQVISG
jgi:hypothetical protein